jgi:hypothetical protein
MAGLFGGYTWAVQQGLNEARDHRFAMRDKKLSAMKDFLAEATANGQQLSPKEYLDQVEQMSDGSHWLRGQLDPGTIMPKLIQRQNERAKAVVAQENLTALQQQDAARSIFERDLGQLSMALDDPLKIKESMAAKYGQNPIFSDYLKGLDDNTIGRARATTSASELQSLMPLISSMTEQGAKDYFANYNTPKSVQAAALSWIRERDTKIQEERGWQQHMTELNHKLQKDAYKFQDQLADENLVAAQSVQAVKDATSAMANDPNLAAAVANYRTGKLDDRRAARSALSQFTMGTSWANDLDGFVAQLGQQPQIAVATHEQSQLDEIAKAALSDPTIQAAVARDSTPASILKNLQPLFAQQPYFTNNPAAQKRAAEMVAGTIEEANFAAAEHAYEKLVSEAGPAAVEKAKKDLETYDAQWEPAIGTLTEPDAQMAAQAFSLQFYADPNARQAAITILDDEGAMPAPELAQRLAQEGFQIIDRNSYATQLASQYAAASVGFTPTTHESLVDAARQTLESTKDIDGLLRQSPGATRQDVIASLEQATVQMQNMLVAATKTPASVRGYKEGEVHSLINEYQARIATLRSEAAKVEPKPVEQGPPSMQQLLDNMKTTAQQPKPVEQTGRQRIDIITSTAKEIAAQVPNDPTFGNRKRLTATQVEALADAMIREKGIKNMTRGQVAGILAGRLRYNGIIVSGR